MPTERGWSRGTPAAAGACAHRAAVEGGAAETLRRDRRHFCQPSGKIALDLEGHTHAGSEQSSIGTNLEPRCTVHVYKRPARRRQPFRSSCVSRIFVAGCIFFGRRAAGRAKCKPLARRARSLVVASTRSARAPQASKRALRSLEGGAHRFAGGLLVMSLAAAPQSGLPPIRSTNPGPRPSDSPNSRW